MADSTEMLPITLDSLILRTVSPDPGKRLRDEAGNWNRPAAAVDATLGAAAEEI